MPDRRILSLWLPAFPTDRLCRPGRAEAAWRATALVTMQAVGGRLRITAANAAAAEGGARPGMALADARARVPGLRTVAADPAADAAALAGLADWCGRYTPVVALDGADGLLLETGGSAHLFGGERGLLEDLGARLARAGYAARAAIADTPGAAWAVARHGAEAGTIVPPGGAEAALGPLPAAALRLPPDVAEGLARVGLHRVADLARTARAPLVARFGESVARRLDQALGAAFEPVSPRLPVPGYRLRMAFPEPLAAPDDLAAVARRLVVALCERFARERLGARRLDLAFYGVEGTVRRAAIGTSRPARDPDHLMRLLREPLAGIDVGLGAEIAILTAPETEPLGTAQLDLPHAPGLVPVRDPAALAGLVDRLGAALGPGSVVRQDVRESHLPERAAAAVPALAPRDPDEPLRTPTFLRWPLPRPRPLRLLARPEPIEAVALVPDHPPVAFRWRRIPHRVRRAEGPERIAPEWWRGEEAEEETTRDYFVVEAEGRRLWIYREGLYVSGVREGFRPGWFVQGTFG